MIKCWFWFEFDILRHFQPLNLKNTYFCLSFDFDYYCIFNHKNEILFFLSYSSVARFLFTCQYIWNLSLQITGAKFVKHTHIICVMWISQWIYVLCGDRNESNKNILALCVIYILGTINLAFQKCAISEDLVVPRWRH